MNQSTQTPALLLVGHGTRGARGTAQFLELAQAVARRRPGQVVRHAWLEHSRPSVEAALCDMAGQQINQVVIVPLLLFASRHWQLDLPAEIERATAQYPALRAFCARPLANHPDIGRLAARRVAATVSRCGVKTFGNVQLLVAARGSRSETVRSACQELASEIARRAGIPSVEVAYLGICRPNLPESLARIRCNPSAWVVCLPLLLFAGELTERLYRTIKQQADRAGEQQFLMAEPLGTNGELVDIVLSRHDALSQRHGLEA